MITYDAFRHFKLFNGLDLSQAFLERLATVGEEVSVAAGDWLFHEDDHADALYLIQHGAVTLKLLVNPEKNILSDMSTLGDGDSLGWSVMVKPYVYRLGAIATVDTQLIKLDGEKLRALTKEDPEDGYLLMQGITQTMASRLQDVSHHIPELSIRNILSMVLIGLAIFTGVLAFLVLVGVIYALATGDTNSIGLVLCLLVPAILYLAAQSVQEGGVFSAEMRKSK
jgi:CRP/FNR family cyclic AMP-dependent transcriptional regulator